MLTNNDILKKLRIALSLKDDDILQILALSEFEITKGALGDLFRNPEHPNFKEAQDQILRNFLNGLIIKNRGKMVELKPDMPDTKPAPAKKMAPRPTLAPPKKRTWK